ncbi:MAG: hypothetical protein JWM43_1764 [Acidobacteriaceae bacterium]|nr:hypothetical protein [Acidobacteriaceae bacterium]
MFRAQKEGSMRTFGKVQALVLSGAMLFSVSAPLMAQNGYYNGVRQGSRGYNNNYDQRYADRNHRGDDRYRQQQGGIGPGKGALIGGAGGAALGALFGGGLKGAIIGGAAGAGVGAVAGKVHQDNKRNDYRDYRR